MKDILRTLVMAKYFCDENNGGLCNEALQTAQKQVVLAQQTTNSQSVTALTELRNDILLVGLPYSKSWADRVDEVIQRLNAEK